MRLNLTSPPQNTRRSRTSLAILSNGRAAAPETAVLLANQTAARELNRLTRIIDASLQQVLTTLTVGPQRLHEAIQYCVFPGGKRFRPLLCLAGARAGGGQPRHALPVACALELIHTYSLVHDDLPAMDNAQERRGRPACHRQFGEGHAVLIGDALLTAAFELLSRFESPNSLRIVRTISAACGTQGLIGGQVLDLEIASRPQIAGEPALREIAQRKTGALIMASVVAGGLAAGGTPSQITRLRRYGEAIGLAFQLIDDVHDQDGLARVMGIDAAQAAAHRLITDGVRLLKPFGAHADWLQELARGLMST